MKKIYILGLLLILGSTNLLRSQANIIASYNFNGGSAADNSGNGYTGTFFGSSAVVDTLTIGYNTSDYFSVPASVLNSRVQFSIAFKIKFTGFNITGSSPTNSIFSADNSSTAGIFALAYQKDVNKWRFGNNSTSYDFADNTIVTGKWYCITLTRDNSGNIKLYVDGIMNPTINFYATPINITNFIVGQETDCFAGCFAANQSAYSKFDDIKFYDRALTSSEILANCAVLINVRENEAFSMQVYPNPVNGSVLKIKNTSNINNFSLSISSIDGKQIKETFYKNETEIDLNIHFLKPGIYFLTIIHDSQSSVLKFIRQ